MGQHWRGDAGDVATGMAQIGRPAGDAEMLGREAITMAYYDAYTYREVAELLGTALPTSKMRMRDGLIRMRDCLEVNIG
jgi:RNA polymerase sigma-70 factor, ECF subfamily